jgi:hypothetical protein
MKEHGTAAAGDRGLRVVIDLDDEIIEVIVTREPVAAILTAKLDRLVIKAARRVFTPGILGTDGANRQKRLWPRRAIGAPPQSPWPESPFRGSSVALALAGDDSTSPQRDRDRVLTGHEPAAAGVTGSSPDLNRRQRLAARYF